MHRLNVSIVEFIAEVIAAAREKEFFGRGLTLLTCT
jgi:hypothetical protein